MSIETPGKFRQRLSAWICLAYVTFPLGVTNLSDAVEFSPDGYPPTARPTDRQDPHPTGSDCRARPRATEAPLLAHREGHAADRIEFHRSGFQALWSELARFRTSGNEENAAAGISRTLAHGYAEKIKGDTARSGFAHSASCWPAKVPSPAATPKTPDSSSVHPDRTCLPVPQSCRNRRPEYLRDGKDALFRIDRRRSPVDAMSPGWGRRLPISEPTRKSLYWSVCGRSGDTNRRMLS